ncbi:NADH-quinone oxidoreductase subunit L [Acetobacter oeni]|uniref:NADH-quinone oxidoreductase subunit L n=1 Tax=Acetobacter oeni TaxID=304077 RepID=A0A511XH86_9PROT|nr:NADH-quinone oxidoreductase subunit L [Acetobacter oeni]MBB3882452.1 NADH-quinone oxidoreductase subunit L [Acetobacter oeni]NHO18454.1 NADH-quinone oxidoreductase subunit L [Acetobacter oeni]GBR06232.1 NADH-quinone oxidoreductase chain L [Acetobacter oeni LMG 21952]GEN62307.1 NADH-quinone oxidoreductase subunit L [Acetobacter oeni]
MTELLLPLTVLAPLAAAVILFLSAGRLPARQAGPLATAAVGLSAIISTLLAVIVLSAPPSAPIRITLWNWMTLPGFPAEIAFALDPLSLLMILIVTIVGFLIHLYAIRYMQNDPDTARFFGSMTLFVAAMLVLVLSSDLLCLFIGWEGVGLCSWLLIGFWYTDPANTAAARKAFLITRTGDAALLCGLLLLATRTGTLRIDTLLQAVTSGQIPPAPLTAVALLLLTGALAKSAQIPFQSWLPDAMAGPTPTSALIHAATMVTAGIYLIARLHVLFAATPAVMTLMAVIGTLTLLMAACNALVQTDLKRILAWSTVSQLGYMFLALGTGIWQAALFHLMTHAFFKALLFLTAGAIIERVRHERNIFHMGGLLRATPGLAAAFLTGAAALAGLPLITAGFYSKELILSSVWQATFPVGGGLALSGHVLWSLALAGAFLTTLYIFRCFFIVFSGPPQTEISGTTPRLMTIPLACLSLLSLLGGIVEMPDTLAPVHLFTRMLDPSHPLPHTSDPAWLLLAGALTPIAGLALAWTLWGSANPVIREAPVPTPGAHRVLTARTVESRWRPGIVPDALFLRPLRILNRIGRYDLPDRLSDSISRALCRASTLAAQTRTSLIAHLSSRTLRITREGSLLLGRMQNGRVRWYAAWIATGLCATLAAAMLA